MWRNTDYPLSKNLALASIVLCISPFSAAIDCQQAPSQLKQVCSSQFEPARQQLHNSYLTGLLISDAPSLLLKDTHATWLQQLQQCKSTRCTRQQIEQRIDALNTYISLNQSLTQHYLKVENGQLTHPSIHLKLHQLSKDSIKIEALAYRNPNNRLEKQTVSLLAYTTPQQKSQILDNEHDCKYDIHYSKALLVVKTKQKGCERFTGIYRLYD